MKGPANWLDRILDALTTALSKAPDADAALPPDAQRALEQQYDLDQYRRDGGGVAPPDAPHIEDDGTI